ncbi:MAG TPA: hypothetical protein VF190_03600 [Rhodothermales bacterium]
MMLRAVNGEQVGEHTFNGEDLERWATKLLVGAATSGNLSTSDHQKLEVGTVPLEWLRFLFSERTVPENCGFHFVTNPIEGMEAATNLSWQVVPGPANSIAGVSLKIANFFQFVTTVLHPLDESPGVVPYRRPGGFVLGFPRELGHIKLSWPETRLRGSLILNIVRPSVDSDLPPHVAMQRLQPLLRSRSRAPNPAPVDAGGSSDLVARLRSLLSDRDLSPRDRHDAEAWLSLLINRNATDGSHDP